MTGYKYYSACSSKSPSSEINLNGRWCLHCIYNAYMRWFNGKQYLFKKTPLTQNKILFYKSS